MTAMPEATLQPANLPSSGASRKREPRSEAYTEHPDPELLEGLMRNELSAAERRRLIRHLLTGCPRCVKVTRRCWMLGSRLLINVADTAVDGSRLPE